MTVTARANSLLLCAAFVALQLSISGCDGRNFAGETSNKPEERMVVASMTGINHTNTFIASFYVDGAWGGNISPIQEGGGGGKSAGGLMLPYRYRTGLKAHVRWNHTETAEDHWKETEAEVAPYADGGGHLWVHFFPNDQVVLIASEYGPAHPNYPCTPKRHCNNEDEQFGEAN